MPSGIGTDYAAPLPSYKSRRLSAHATNSRRDGCPRTVRELLLLTGLELSLERKQMPQVVENVENECS